MTKGVVVTLQNFRASIGPTNRRETAVEEPLKCTGLPYLFARLPGDAIRSIWNSRCFHRPGRGHLGDIRGRHLTAGGFFLLKYSSEQSDHPGTP